MCTNQNGECILNIILCAFVSILHSYSDYGVLQQQVQEQQVYAGGDVCDFDPLRMLLFAHDVPVACDGYHAAFTGSDHDPCLLHCPTAPAASRDKSGNLRIVLSVWKREVQSSSLKTRNNCQ